MIRHTISLAHSLGMKVLAEGVEKAKQVEILRSLSCDEIQGFLLCTAFAVGKL